MKAKNLLKVLFTAVAVFAFSATFAQVQDENEPWIEMTAGTGIVDSVVINMTVPKYVEPDPILNNLPGPYDPTQSNADQNINSNFNWDEVTGDVTLTAPSGEASGELAPYREVTSATAGTYTITVKEENAAGCEDGTGNSQDITFIGEPSYTVNTTTYEVCDGETEPILIDIAGPGLNNWSNFYILMDAEKGVSTTSDVYSHTDTIVEVGTVPGNGINIFPDEIWTVHNDGDDQVTEYTFTLQGINHHISRKGDFLNLKDNGAPQLDITSYDAAGDYNMDEGLYTWFDAGGETITVTVYPTPSTGTIYYVPNNYEL